MSVVFHAGENIERSDFCNRWPFRVSRSPPPPMISPEDLAENLSHDQAGAFLSHGHAVPRASAASTAGSSNVTEATLAPFAPIESGISSPAPAPSAPTDSSVPIVLTDASASSSPTSASASPSSALAPSASTLVPSLSSTTSALPGPAPIKPRALARFTTQVLSQPRPAATFKESHSGRWFGAVATTWTAEEEEEEEQATANSSMAIAGMSTVLPPHRSTPPVPHASTSATNAPTSASLMNGAPMTSPTGLALPGPSTTSSSAIFLPDAVSTLTTAPSASYSTPAATPLPGPSLTPGLRVRAARKRLDDALRTIARHVDTLDAQTVRIGHAMRKAQLAQALNEQEAASSVPAAGPSAVTRASGSSASAGVGEDWLAETHAFMAELDRTAGTQNIKPRPLTRMSTEVIWSPRTGYAPGRSNGLSSESGVRAQLPALEQPVAGPSTEQDLSTSWSYLSSDEDESTEQGFGARTPTGLAPSCPLSPTYTVPGALASHELATSRGRLRFQDGSTPGCGPVQHLGLVPGTTVLEYHLNASNYGFVPPRVPTLGDLECKGKARGDSRLPAPASSKAKADDVLVDLCTGAISAEEARWAALLVAKAKNTVAPDASTSASMPSAPSKRKRADGEVGIEGRDENGSSKWERADEAASEEDEEGASPAKRARVDVTVEALPAVVDMSSVEDNRGRGRAATSASPATFLPGEQVRPDSMPPHGGKRSRSPSPESDDERPTKKASPWRTWSPECQGPWGAETPTVLR